MSSNITILFSALLVFSSPLFAQENPQVEKQFEVPGKVDSNEQNSDEQPSGEPSPDAPATAGSDKEKEPAKAELAESEIAETEYDTWQGSSLGVRILADAEGYYIEMVLPHVTDSPLKADDRILQVGELDLADSLLSKLGDLLKSTAPETVLDIKIIRDSEELVVPVTTLRHQFVDIARLVERIKANRIITAHLKEKGRLEELDTITDRMIEAVKSSSSPRLAYEGINQVIDEFGISHSALVPASTYQQLRGGDGGEMGFAIRRFSNGGNEGYFVIDSKPGTIAYESEIKLGDEILVINGVKVGDSRRLMLAGEEQRYKIFAIDADEGEEVRIEYRKSENGELLTTQITVGGPVELYDSVSKSAKVIEHKEHTFGYVRFWNLMSPLANRALTENIESTFSGCDGLILDLRGRGGVIQAVNAIERTVEKLDKPVVAITDELTRSAKELLSYKLKKLEDVWVIGEKTSGAVTACGFYELPSGNVFMYPAVNSRALSRFTDGNVLEGKGVEPDENVDFYEAYCNGKDLLLDSAVDRAAKMVDEFLSTE